MANMSYQEWTEAAPPWREREVVTVPEAAVILGVGRAFLYEQARLGELGAFQVGHKWLIPTARLRALLDPPPAA